jgi:hypothetical protein
VSDSYKEHPLILIFHVDGADHFDVELHGRSKDYESAQFGQVRASLITVIEDRCHVDKQTILLDVDAAYARIETHARRTRTVVQ